MAKVIWFDMDGTVYDLYGVKDWLFGLRREQTYPYTDGKPLVNMNELAQVCGELIGMGWVIGVATWGARGSTREYAKRVEQAKREWVDEHMPYVSDFRFMGYGVKKQNGVPATTIMILVDDNDDVRMMWETPIKRKGIDAKGDIIQELRRLLE